MVYDTRNNGSWIPYRYTITGTYTHTPKQENTRQWLHTRLRGRGRVQHRRDISRRMPEKESQESPGVHARGRLVTCSRVYLFLASESARAGEGKGSSHWQDEQGGECPRMLLWTHCKHLLLLCNPPLQKTYKKKKQEISLSKNIFNKYK